MKKRARLIKFFTRVFRLWRNFRRLGTYTPTHRLVNIEKNEQSEYFVTIQLIGKNIIQKISPEELLTDDKMTNRFSPTDIRALTYLGYLDMNAPKYKILAKKLSEKNDQMLFALHKKGEKEYAVLTASEIVKDAVIIKNLTQEEACMLGMTAGSEHQAIEAKQKKELLKALSED